MKSFLLPETILGPDGSTRFQKFGMPLESGDFSEWLPLRWGTYGTPVQASLLEAGRRPPGPCPRVPGPISLRLAQVLQLWKEMGPMDQMSSKALC